MFGSEVGSACLVIFALFSCLQSGCRRAQHCILTSSEGEVEWRPSSLLSSLSQKEEDSDSELVCEPPSPAPTVQEHMKMKQKEPGFPSPHGQPQLLAEQPHVLSL